MALKLPRIRLLPALAVLALSIFFGLQGAMSVVPVQAPPRPLPYLPWITGAIGVWFTLPIPITAVLNVPDPRASWRRFLGLNLLGYVALTVISMSIARALNAVIWALLGVESQAGPWLLSLRAELPHSSVSYLAIVTAFTAIHAVLARREVQRRLAEHERMLARSRVHALTARLEPEPVLATLASLRDAMQHDLPRAERLIDELATRLRGSLAELDSPSFCSRAEPPASTQQLPSALFAAETLAPWWVRASRWALLSLGVGCAAAPFRWPRLSVSLALRALSICCALALLQATVVLRLYGEDPRLLFATYLGRAVGVWLALPVVQTFVLNAPNLWRHFVRCAGMFWLGELLFVRIYWWSLVGTRVLCAQLLDLSLEPDWQRIEFALVRPAIGATYAGLVGLFVAARMWDQHRLEQQRAAELGSLVAKAQLETISAQLEPHFLYNALNTLSSLMYRDVARTRALIESLSDLLRAALAKPTPTWTLAEERAHTMRFVALIEARFGDRISVHWLLPPGLDDKLEVPRFALQALVENAVKHNQQRRGSLTICIEAEAKPKTLRLTVSDDGDGFDFQAPRARPGAGGGLTRLEQALGLLYGRAGKLDRQNGHTGGARVEVELPGEVRS